MSGIQQTVTLGVQPWPHATAASLAPSAAGTAWDDGSIYSARMVKNLDGTLYRDSSGYAYVTYLASTKSMQDATGTDNDRPGLYKTLDFVTFTKVSTSAPLLTWGTGTWVTDGSVWDGRVIQLWAILWDGSRFIAFYDGDAGENPYETYAQGIATATNVAGPYTKYASNPTFSRASPSAQDEVIYGGDVIYDPDDSNANKRWKNFYVGKSNSLGNSKIMLATAASYLGPWTRQGVVFSAPAATYGYNWGLAQVWKTGASSLGAIYEVYTSPMSMHYMTSADAGVTWTDQGKVMQRTGAGWESGTSFYWSFHLWDSTTNTWRLTYTQGTGSGEVGLRIATSSWHGARTTIIT